MAIKQQGGRWFTELSLDEERDQLIHQIQSLTPGELEAFRILMQETGQQELVDNSLLKVLTTVEYDRECVDIETWLSDDYYMGSVGKSLYPQLKQDIIDIFSGDYDEVILTGSIGWGKTYGACVMLLRVVYELSCMVCPQESFGLGATSPITFPNYSVTDRLSRKVVFGTMMKMLQSSPYFTELGYKETTKELTIPRKNLSIEALSSTRQSALGTNVFASILDETNFMKILSGTTSGQKETYKEADVLYNSLSTRIKSRFMRYGRVPGLLILVSSKTSEDSFTERKLLESRNNPRIFVRDAALYDIKPGYEQSEKFRVLVGRGPIRSRILEEGENVEPILDTYEGTRVVEVPEDFRTEFDRDLEDSLRDIAGVSVENITPYFHQTDKVEKCVDKNREHPFTCIEYDPQVPYDDFIWERLVKQEDRGGYVPIINPDAPRHIHIDPSLLVKGGDAAGLAVGHIAGIKAVTRRDRNGNIFAENAPIIYIDFMVRVIPPLSGEEGSLGDIRKLVYELAEHGYPIRKVSLDQYNSADTLNKFSNQGYQTEVVSMDKTTDPYDMLKAALYEHRVVLYPYKPFIREISSLEYKPKTKKIDHPKGGKKDVADAVAGVVYTLTMRAKDRPMELGAGMQYSEFDNRGQQTVHQPKRDKKTGLMVLPLQPQRRMDDILAEGDDYELNTDLFDVPIILG